MEPNAAAGAAQGRGRSETSPPQEGTAIYLSNLIGSLFPGGCCHFSLLGHHLLSTSLFVGKQSNHLFCHQINIPKVGNQRTWQALVNTRLARNYYWSISLRCFKCDQSERLRN